MDETKKKREERKPLKERLLGVIILYIINIKNAHAREIFIFHFFTFSPFQRKKLRQFWLFIYKRRILSLENIKKTKEVNIPSFDEASYYQDHYDEYLDDPEDEIRFPPEIFDANAE